MGLGVAVMVREGGCRFIAEGFRRVVVVAVAVAVREGGSENGGICPSSMSCPGDWALAEGITSRVRMNPSEPNGNDDIAEVNKTI